MFRRQLLRLCTLALISSPIVFSHSWVEQLNVIAANGTLIEPAGYPRGNVKRSSPDFSDPKMVFLIPPGGGATEILPSQLMCKETQVNQVQTDGSPRLSASPGASIALRYQENGHVSLPANQPGKPANRGTNFVYYTSESQPDDKFLAIHRVWNVDGTSGDGRGRLISTRDFDDSQCYQINSGSISGTRQKEFSHEADQLQGADLWCQQDIQIPLDAKPGSTITLYWVWDWPTMPGTPGFPNGKQEIYTTCMDVDIVAKTAVSNKVVAAGFIQQDIANAAVSAQFVDIANPTAVPSPNAIAFANAEVSSSSSAASIVSPSSSSSSSSSSTTTTTTMSTESRKPCPHSSSTTEDYDETVTVTETVTATPEATTTPPVVTVTEDDRVTMIVTNTIYQKRQSGLPEISAGFKKLTSTPVITTSSSGSTSISSHKPCSTTEPAFRLRARIPFYVLPPDDSGTGC